jgi:hypothetical protein
MKGGKNDNFILAAIVVFALVSANELGYGAIAFLPLTLLAVWLRRKAWGQ